MIKITLTRKETSDAGTFGGILVPISSGERLFATAELPWRNNAVGESCIPAGEYVVQPRQSQKFGECYELQDVPSRSAILIHTGNYAGDIKEGLKSDVRGCILIGYYKTVLGVQEGVANSRKAFEEFKALIGRNKFLLEIKEEY